MLAPIYEVWNWSDGGIIFVGVVLLIYTAYGLGFFVGSGGAMRDQPWWVQVTILTFCLGVILALAPTS